MSDSPFELRQLVTVATFSTHWEAQFAQARLGAEGIHSLIAGEHVIRMVALSNAIGGVQLQVREEDAQAAVEALQGMAPLPEMYLVGAAGAETPELDGLAAGEAMALAEPDVGAGHDATPQRDRCPSCGSGDLQVERSTRLLMGVLPVSRKAYRCGSCGILWNAQEIGGEPLPTAADRPPEGTSTEGDAGDPAGDPAAASAAKAPLATVARFHTPWEAHLARTFLESEGLRASVVEDLLPAVNLLSAQPAPRNRLEVRQGDARRATAILARAWSYPSRVAAPESDPEDGPGSR
jgi:Putative prokaryotic signal transducing protein